ncbi:chaperone protein dnaJ 11, chloroplastic-like [Juglans regia]|uniref:Chaperone protein dnaJ 11, chloroplastic-like n=1 Tax=Juglans regia TaxID=51240 RepID=A0A2I4F8R2_JUGRE|nr:chaperone protein dnaJ 11, chloroplastic-like [Juglans regia]
MPGYTSLHPPKSSFGSNIFHPNSKNPLPMLPRHACVKTQRRTIPLCAATATERVDGSVRTMKSSLALNGTFYQLLRVKVTASQTEIKAAYRNLAKQYHPDAVVGSSADRDARDFIEIHNAYTTLSDPVARARYDLTIGAINIAHSCPYRYMAGFPSPTRSWETDQCW